ncbi:MAG: GerMN domain-containing protein [Patescibacteria group bacterium]|nr:GerMN domain-containing protein [Patescibacteria group bacterium]
MIKEIFYTILIVLIAITLGGLVYLFLPQIGGSSETMTIRIFFSNTYEDPESFFCDTVYFVERQIKKTETPIYSTIEEMLEGPNKIEKQGGFFTNIDDNVKIQNLSIQNGTARIDFNKSLEQSAQGSCKTMGMVAQIIHTLKEFEEVDEVIISIDGRTVDILQP